MRIAISKVSLCGSTRVPLFDVRKSSKEGQECDVRRRQHPARGEVVEVRSRRAEGDDVRINDGTTTVW